MEEINEEVKEENTTESVRVSEVEVEKNKTLKNNTLGLISFIFSMVGLLIMGLPCGIVAVVTGIISIIKFNNEEEKNKWMGITGLCVGAADILLVLLFAMSL